MAEPGKAPAAQVSGTKVMEQLAFLTRMIELRHRPREMYVYKPRQDGSGTALKVQLRVIPEFPPDKTYISKVDGGLFLELAPQLGEKGPDGFARFDWATDGHKITAKLGVPDITTILVGIREVRYRGKATPKSTRTKSDTDGTTVSMFHKFEASTTSIALKFEADATILYVSKSKDVKQSIKLTLQEERALEAYLIHALDVFHEVGA
jgi:hypothetical protein